MLLVGSVSRVLLHKEAISGVHKIEAVTDYVTHYGKWHHLYLWNITNASFPPTQSPDVRGFASF